MAEKAEHHLPAHRPDLNGTIDIIAAPRFDPMRDRVTMTVPAGSPVSAIVYLAMPEIHDIARVRVWVNDMPIAQAEWADCYPKAGDLVVVRVRVGKALRSILSIVITVAAVALGQFYAVPLASALGISPGIANSLIVGTVTIVGNLLLSALIPMKKPEKDKPEYRITGWQNPFDPDGVVGCLLGKCRWPLAHAARPYGESDNAERYARALFHAGYGPIEIAGIPAAGVHLLDNPASYDLDKIQIGETPIGDYDEVEIEIRCGYPTDDAVTLYPKQVIESSIGVPLTYDDAAASPAEGKPVSRFTASDAQRAEIDFVFPSGLVQFKKSGEKRGFEVNFRIRSRLNGAGAWTYTETLKITDDKAKPVTKTHILPNFATRGRYEIEITRLDYEDPEETQEISAAEWALLRSFRPEYPLNFNKPLALICVRAKSQRLLNGVVDGLNIEATRVALDWNYTTSAWVQRATSNPASLARFVLQGPCIRRPYPDAAIDLPSFQAFHDFCRVKGLEYNRYHESAQSVWDTMVDVCRAGRATPEFRQGKWSILIDTPQSAVVAHIGARNSWGFERTRPTVRPPDAFRVKFNDETNMYKLAERVVPWPGFVGTPEITEALVLPGKTDPGEIWIEARKAMYEVIYRPDTFVVSQDFEALLVDRGKLVKLSHDTIDAVMRDGRVKAVAGNLVELDAFVDMTAAGSYAVRFRRTPVSEIAAGDPPATSLLRSVVTVAGRTDLIELSGPGSAPVAGDYFQFGTSGSETFEAIVKSVESTDNLSSRVILTPHAPNIETLLDAEVPPAWDGRYGAEVSTGTQVPAVPRILAVESDLPANDAAAVPPIKVFLRGGTGDGKGIKVMTWEVRHRTPPGSGAWNENSAPVAAGAVSLTAGAGYAVGNVVEFQARGISPAGVASSYTATRNQTVGAGVNVPGIPVDFTVTLVAGVPRSDVRATWTFPNDDSDYAKVYRAPTGAPFGTATIIFGHVSGTNNQTVSRKDLQPAAGTYDYFVRVYSVDDVPGPAAGPATITVPP